MKGSDNLIKIEYSKFRLLRCPCLGNEIAIYISKHLDQDLSVEILDLLFDYLFYHKNVKQVQNFLDKNSDVVKLIYLEMFDLVIITEDAIYYFQEVPSAKEIREKFKGVFN